MGLEQAEKGSAFPVEELYKRRILHAGQQVRVRVQPGQHNEHIRDNVGEADQPDIDGPGYKKHGREQ